jgi:hypothetical protein
LRPFACRGGQLDEGRGDEIFTAERLDDGTCRLSDGRVFQEFDGRDYGPTTLPSYSQMAADVMCGDQVR